MVLLFLSEALFAWQLLLAFFSHLLLVWLIGAGCKDQTFAPHMRGHSPLTVVEVLSQSQPPFLLANLVEFTILASLTPHYSQRTYGRSFKKLSSFKILICRKSSGDL
jgi:hypothetical protein